MRKSGRMVGVSAKGKGKARLATVRGRAVRIPASTLFLRRGQGLVEIPEDVFEVLNAY